MYLINNIFDNTGTAIINIIIFIFMLFISILSHALYLSKKHNKSILKELLDVW